jgi:hypothetical protein
MNKKIVKSFLITVCLFTNVLLFAQPGDTDGTPTDNLEGTDPPANINSYVIILMLFAILFGFMTFKINILKFKKRY